MANDTQIDIDKEIEKRFRDLPRVLQEAIVSTDVSKHLRSLADTHKLHVDQWQRLENEVMLTLLGIQEIDTFPADIQDGRGIPAEDAAKLAGDISVEIFEPIRKELERELDHPAAEQKVVSDIEASRSEILGSQKAPPPSTLVTAAVPTPTTAPVVLTPQVLPATPPTPAPETKAVRAPISSSYTAQAPSHERKSVEGDPYREQIA